MKLLIILPRFRSCPKIKSKDLFSHVMSHVNFWADDFKSNEILNLFKPFVAENFTSVKKREFFATPKAMPARVI